MAKKCRLTKIQKKTKEKTPVKSFKDRATEFLNQEKDKAVSDKMHSKIQRQGTFADRVMARIHTFMDNPIPNVQLLDELVTMMQDGTRHHQHDLMTQMVEVFEEVLPSDRVLLPFEEREFKPTVTDVELARALYEAELKPVYLRYLKCVEQMTYDTITKRRVDAMRTLQGLMVSKPEQDATILAILVNKIGDTEKKVASEAVHLLARLLGTHTAMCVDVAAAVDGFIHGSITMHSLRYALSFLSQMVLTRKLPIADQLVASYLHVFVTQLKLRELGHYSAAAIQAAQTAQEGKTNGKKGKKGDKAKDDEKDNTPIKPVHTPGLTSSDDLAYDPTVVTTVLKGLARAAPFITDKKAALARFEPHTTELFAMARTSPLPTALSCLTFLLELTTPETPAHQHVCVLLYHLLRSPELRTSSHGQELVRLVGRAAATDKDGERGLALLRRALQAFAVESPALACGVMMTMPHTMRRNKTVRTWVKAGRAAPEEADGIIGTIEGDDGLTLNIQATETAPPTTEDENKGDEKTEKPKITVYDPTHPNPRMAGAAVGMAWELGVMATHYHPSVRAIADDVAAKGKVGYSGNPADDFAFIRFLDRFADKKTKAAPLAGEGMTHVGVPSRRKATDLPAVSQFFTEFNELTSHAAKRAAVTWDVEDDDEYEEVMMAEMAKWDDEC